MIKSFHPTKTDRVFLFAVSLFSICLLFSFSSLQAESTFAAPTFEVEITPTHVTCYGANDGTATVSITGGVAPFEVTWLESGNTGLTETGLAPGIVSCTVTDATGETKFKTNIILEPDPFTASLVSTIDPTSAGACDGQVDLEVEGGTAPYTVNWPQGASDNGLSASGLCAQQMMLTVTDASGCTVTLSVELVAPDNGADPMQISVSTTGVLCFGNDNGTATVSITGGVGPYDFEWTQGNFAGVADAYSAGDIQFDKTGFHAGLHVFTVTDLGTGLSDMYEFIIDEPEVLLAYVTASSPTTNCVACDGGFDLQIQGGTPPYSIGWPDGAVISDDGLTATGVCTGVHSIIVTDSNNCYSSASLVLNCDSDLEDDENIEIIADITTTKPSCPGSPDATAEISNISGGTGTYTYEWAHDNSTGSTASGLSPGANSVAVTDTNGNTTLISFEVEDAIFSLSVVTTDASPNQCNGTAAFQDLIGGTPPFEMEEFMYDFNALCPGDYYFSVIDGNGCMATAEFTINETEPWEPGPQASDDNDGLTLMGTGNVVVVYDNTDKVMLIQKSASFVQGAAFKIFSSNGALVQQGTISERTTLLDTQGLRTGVYLVQSGRDVVRFMVR